MASRNMPKGEGHGQDRQPESQRDANEADAKRGIAGRNDGRTATCKDQPERAEHLGNGAFE